MMMAVMTVAVVTMAVMSAAVHHVMPAAATVVTAVMAAVPARVAGGGRIGDLDVEVCPVAPKVPIANFPQNPMTTNLAWNPVKVTLTQKPGHPVTEHALREAPIS